MLFVLYENYKNMSEHFLLCVDRLYSTNCYWYKHYYCIFLRPYRGKGLIIKIYVFIRYCTPMTLQYHFHLISFIHSYTKAIPYSVYIVHNKFLNLQIKTKSVAGTVFVWHSFN